MQSLASSVLASIHIFCFGRFFQFHLHCRLHIFALITCSFSHERICCLIDSLNFSSYTACICAGMHCVGNPCVLLCSCYVSLLLVCKFCSFYRHQYCLLLGHYVWASRNHSIEDKFYNIRLHYCSV